LVTGRKNCQNHKNRWHWRAGPGRAGLYHHGTGPGRAGYFRPVQSTSVL